MSKKFFVTIVMNHLCKILLSNWRVGGLGVLSDVFSESFQDDYLWHFSWVAFIEYQKQITFKGKKGLGPTGPRFAPVLVIQTATLCLFFNKRCVVMYWMCQIEYPMQCVCAVTNNNFWNVPRMVIMELHVWLFCIQIWIARQIWCD